jgi:hypothetical protein
MSSRDSRADPLLESPGRRGPGSDATASRSLPDSRSLTDGVRRDDGSGPSRSATGPAAARDQEYGPVSAPGRRVGWADHLAPAREAATGTGQPSFGGPVPGDRSGVDEDNEPTNPLPVILPGAASVPRPVPVEAPRGPFEAARPASSAARSAGQQSTRPVSITGSVQPPPPVFPAAPPGPPQSGRVAGVSRPVSESARAKLDQIKDLYLTAEAIGEDNLDKHFDQVSQRQRELIREFFERSGPADGQRR